MPIVYGDLSGSETGYLTAGCYLGHEHEWVSAEEAWRAVLNEAGVREFHATDFFNARGEFDDPRWRHEDPKRGWIPGGAEYDRLASRVAAVAVDAGLLGFSYTLDAKAFTEILAPVLRLQRRKHSAAHPRTFAVMSALSAIGDFLERASYRRAGEIDVLFEHEHGAGRFMSFLDECRDRRERFVWWFRSFATEPKSSVRIQIADLLAHETWRRAKHAIEGSDRPLRRTFQRMLEGERIDVRTHDRNHCEKNAAAVRAVLQQYPHGLVPHGQPIPSPEPAT